MKTETSRKPTVGELNHELHMYHCAGGHTRAAMAKAKLIEAGFRFEGNEIFYPDGVKRVSDTSGNTVPHDWTAKAANKTTTSDNTCPDPSCKKPLTKWKKDDTRACTSRTCGYSEYLDGVYNAANPHRLVSLTTHAECSCGKWTYYGKHDRANFKDHLAQVAKPFQHHENGCDGHLGEEKNCSTCRVRAAAPEMLAALHEAADLLTENDFTGPTVNAIFAAIAKAEVH